MKVLMNAYNLRIGGGESVGLGIINSIYSFKTDYHYYIIINSNVSYAHFSTTKNISIYRIPPFFTRYKLGNLFSFVYLIHLSYRIKPDVIFSMGNYAIPVRKKQLVLLHWPYLAYPDSIVWKKMGTLDYIKRKIRAILVTYKLKYATAITVQTSLMKTRLEKYGHYKGPIHVVESSTSFSSPMKKEVKLSPTLAKLKLFRQNYPSHRFILLLSVYYTHKNFEILIPLAKEFKKNQDKFKLFVSLDPNQNVKAKKLLKIIREEQLEDIIINLGPIQRSSLLEVYQNSDVFFMPTLLESFGITYLEAMTTHLPIFTSDLDFAHEVCGDVAFYFDPLSYQSIYSSFVDAFKDPVLIQKKIALGKDLSSSFLSWEEITKKYLQILEKL